MEVGSSGSRKGRRRQRIRGQRAFGLVRVGCLGLLVLAAGIDLWTPGRADAAPGAVSLGGYEDESLVAGRNLIGGGQIVVGWTDSFGAGDRDAWVLKLDANGTPEWQRTYGGPGRDEARFVELVNTSNPDPGYLVVGVTESFGAGGEDIWVLRLDESGDVLWEKTYGGTGTDAAAMVAKERVCLQPGEPDRESDWAIAGTTDSFGAGDFDAWLLRLDDATGDLIWSRTYGSAAFGEGANSVAATTCGEWILGSDTATFGAANGDLWILKLDEAGSVEWEKRYGGADLDARAHVVQTDDDGDGSADDGYLVAGVSYSWLVAGLNQDVWVLKLDPLGAITWQMAFGTGSFEVVSGVGEDGSGFFVAGSSFDDFIDPARGEGFFVKLTAAGAIEWARGFDGPDFQVYDDVSGLGDLRVGFSEPLLTGSTESFVLRGLDGWVLRTDAAGEIPGCAAQDDWSASSATTTGTSADTTAIVGTPIGVSVASHAESVADTTVTARNGCEIELAAILQLPKTGQTTSYDTGNADDGHLEVGLPWPTPRFVSNGDGTATDELTGLVWLVDADCADTIGYDPNSTGDGRLSQPGALAFIDEINAGSLDVSGCGYTGSDTDWRLPNALELESLINIETAEQATWLGSQGFLNVQAAQYWSRTPSATLPTTDGIIANLSTGAVGGASKVASFRAWPVRAGSSGPPVSSARSNLWEEGSDLVSSPSTGVFWPEPRFVAHGDGTATDRLTGFMWLRDFECLGTATWQGALDTVADFNLAIPSGSYACPDYTPGLYGDWRLPNRKELLSLVDFASFRPALPPGHPFLNANQAFYWSSSVYALSSASNAWTPNLWFPGQIGSASRGVTSGRILAVRTPAPEPGFVSLLMAGVAGLGACARRRRESN